MRLLRPGLQQLETDKAVSYLIPRSVSVCRHGPEFGDGAICTIVTRLVVIITILRSRSRIGSPFKDGRSHDTLTQTVLLLLPSDKVAFEFP